MGAQTFIDYTEGADVRTAFQAAIDEARYGYGHRGYTGTIAEKDDYVVIDGGPLSLADATALANGLIDCRDSRIDDKDGPAGAIAIRGGLRTLANLPVPVRVAGYPDQEAAALAAIEGRLDDGETVTSARIGSYRARRGGIEVDEGTTATVVTTGSPEVTGWLFFGWASS